jgi:hypothetical protein
MQLVTVTTTQPTAAEVIANCLIERLNYELVSRARAHVQSYDEFWSHPSATPDEILAAVGSNAATWLACASESVEHIGRLAAIVGKSVTDFIPADKFMPKRAFVIGEGGTVTLAPEA